jgi:GH15 family glucan-1,4-alpha-glucosidase
MRSTYARRSSGGEFLNVVALYAERLGDLDPVVQRFVAEVADTAAREWTLPDAGLWEARSAPQHHVSSKLFCWLALERATELAERIGAGDRKAGWEAERERIRAAILERGWSEARGAFVQAFDGEELDAAALLMPLVGFLPADDPRMRATIEVVARELTEDGLVLRYRAEDGLGGEEGTFLLCSFWLVSCLARLGEVDRARALFERAAGFANDVGLLAEEVDARTGELLGNFPQAFSHVGLITAARDLDRAPVAARSASVHPR